MCAVSGAVRECVLLVELFKALKVDQLKGAVRSLLVARKYYHKSKVHQERSLRQQTSVWRDLTRSELKIVAATLSAG